ncbi:MAG: carbon storage regulator [Planctomycetota bacterium]
MLKRNLDQKSELRIGEGIVVRVLAITRRRVLLAIDAPEGTRILAQRRAIDKTCGKSTMSDEIDVG